MKTQTSITTSITMALFLAWSCADDPGKITNTPVFGSSSKNSANKADSKGTSSKVGKTTRSDGQASGASDSTDNDANAPATSTSTSTDTASGSLPDALKNGSGKGEPDPADAAMAKLLSDCNATKALSAPPGSELFSKHLNGAPITKTVAIVKVTVTPSLDIKVTDSTSTQTSLVEVSKIEPPFLAPLAQGQANQQAAANSGSTTMTNIPVKDSMNLATYKGWDKVVCTLVGTKSIQNNVGSYSTASAYDPPLPSSLNPMASANRYTEEIGDRRVFEGISVNVSSSNNPALSGVTSLTGSVTIEKVTPSAQVNGANLSGDTAYRITNSFGTPAQTWALGLPPTIIMFLNTTTHDLAGVVVDSSAVSGGVLAAFTP